MFEHKRQGAIDVVSGGDRISGDHVADLGKVLSECLKRGGQPRVVLDLQGVALVDSAGLEMMLNTHEECQRHGGAIKLANPGALCSEVLKVTGVGARFEVFGDTGSAVRSFLL
jgi:anti-anti-sigma factor